MIRSAALMLEHGLGREAEARLLDDAVSAALTAAPTPDLGGTATTSDFGDAVVGLLEAELVRSG
jgi:3-isopropylmalate dehydrogenase